MFKNRFKVNITISKKSVGGFNIWYNGTSLVREVLVKGWNQDEDEQHIGTAWFEIQKDALHPYTIYAKQIRQDVGDPYKHEGPVDKLLPGVPFKALWAEIYWRNGRVSHVPLTDIGGAVEYSRSDGFTIHFQSDVDEYYYAADLIHLKE